MVRESVAEPRAIGWVRLAARSLAVSGSVWPGRSWVRLAARLSGWVGPGWVRSRGSWVRLVGLSGLNREARNANPGPKLRRTTAPAARATWVRPVARSGAVLGFVWSIRRRVRLAARPWVLPAERAGSWASLGWSVGFVPPRDPSAARPIGGWVRLAGCRAPARDRRGGMLGFARPRWHRARGWFTIRGCIAACGPSRGGGRRWASTVRP